MRPKLAAGVPALQRAEPIPIGPFTAHDVFRLKHGKESSIGGNCSSVVFPSRPHYLRILRHVLQNLRDDEIGRDAFRLGFKI